MASLLEDVSAQIDGRPMTVPIADQLLSRLDQPMTDALDWLTMISRNGDPLALIEALTDAYVSVRPILGPL